MPIREINATSTTYYLVLFDEQGKERPESNGSLLSEAALKRLADSSNPVTDVFVIAHGWQGDVPAAIAQYDDWTCTMAAVRSDRETAQLTVPGFAPLTVALHWPSLPWGDEELPSGGAVLSAAESIDAQVEAYANRIATTPSARDALRTILDAAQQNPQAVELPPPVLDAYNRLFAESGLQVGSSSARPGSDQDGFDPAAIIADARAGSVDAAAGGNPQLLGLGKDLVGALLIPLRQLSFWKMKDRARQFGENGARALLSRMQGAARNARFHLMGHSFGSIVVSGAVAGAPGKSPLPRAADTLFLVQGALSLWSYAGDIPYAPGTPGYFQRIVGNRLVNGPIVTTRSTYDTAVGRFYPLGARLRSQYVLGGEYPLYGGIGAFGIQGLDAVSDLPIQSTGFRYGFVGGNVYNVDASTSIREGSGPAGAHSDIAHPEVAHVFWSAVLDGIPAPPPAHLFPGLLLSVESALPDAATFVAPIEAEAPPAEPTWGGAQTSQSGAGAISPAPAAAPPSVPAAGESRYVNTEIEGHQRNEALSTGETYILAFDVDMLGRSDALASAALPSNEEMFSPGADEITLTVQLLSDDFRIDKPDRPLRLSRAGKGLSKARFAITPLHDGSSKISATIHKEGNFITEIDLTFDVGAEGPTAAEVSTLGRQLSSAQVVRPRDIGIRIAPAATGYECVVWGAVQGIAHLPLSAALLTSAIGNARRELMKVVMQQSTASANTGEYVFQSNIDVSEADRDIALRTLARGGARLFQQLFFGPDAGADSTAMGEFIRKSALDRSARLKVQIVAASSPIPWGLLYMGDASDGAQLDWDNFLGMRHIIEQIPLQNSYSVLNAEIESDKPDLGVSINLNEAIDVQMKATFVAQQKSYWKNVADSRTPIRVMQRTTTKDVLRALNDVNNTDHILYFYCHAQSTGLSDAGGPDSSSLVLTDARLTLGDLNLDAPMSKQLGGHPLIFINACESAALSAAFYEGFVPYFMAKGARGVVGTECKTPALFATQWAREFFERFINGQSLGEAFLGLRREFLNKHNNPLGLCYAVYCDGDTQIQPALGRSSVRSIEPAAAPQSTPAITRTK